MTIASTMAAMGYVAISATAAECRSCLLSEDSVRGGLFCTSGGFHVAPIGACKRYARRAAAASSAALPKLRKLQIGPTDI